MKLKFRRWVSISLLIILLISFFILGSECDNDLLFFISKVIALVVMVLDAWLLAKYSDIFKN